MELPRIENRLQDVEKSSMEIDVQLGGGINIRMYNDLRAFAQEMAQGGPAVPPHLRDKPGVCQAILFRAVKFGFDPYALAEHSFVMKKPGEIVIEHPNGGRSTQRIDVETVCYDSYVIRAIIKAHAPIRGGLKYTYEGEGDQRKCTVSAELRETGEIVSHTSPTLGDRIKAIGKNDRGQIKGSPLWVTKPDVQLGYDTARDLCRLHFPEVLMGWYDKDEYDEMVRPALATDITPKTGNKDKPDIGNRLKGPRKRQGFDGTSADRTAAEAADANAVVETTTSASKKSESSADVQAETSAPTAKTEETEQASVSEPLARGQRLLAKQKTAVDITDLMNSISEELEGLEREHWINACNARLAEFPKIEGRVT